MVAEAVQGDATSTEPVPRLTWHRHDIRIEASSGRDDDYRRVLLARVESTGTAALAEAGQTGQTGWRTSTRPSIAAGG